MKHRVQRGFTLIEIMVVVIIIGLLAGIVVPNVMESLDKANVQKARADFKALQTALKLYRIDNFNYPTTEQGLESLVTKPTIAPLPRNYKANGYLETLPKDPWGNDYQYMSPGQGHEYDIYSLGADGVNGGDGQNADLSVWDDGTQ
ncbi:type II secretion system protein GspG [Cellvibrio japonicus]|nr:type II secretion system major pseudopilin GspG [Cellvibrio japonicus]QEI14301.1 type II secretion system protein GspG [Cellvibrio japonicus]QEI17878.1 type II secretion system protein GspG [Cellvibrio japonicus]QEI21454.1 type II secretion system protein GspG [Cellvibrio japonicus]